MSPRSGAPWLASARALLVLLLLAAGCASPPPEVLRQPIPGTRVRLSVPEGFAISQRFPGLISHDGASSVFVTEIASPADQIRETLTEKDFADRGMRWLGSEEVTIGEFDADLVSARETEDSGVQLQRWITVLGKEKTSVMLAAVTARPPGDPVEVVLRGVLTTAEWRADELPDPYLGLGFRVSETDLLKISDRLPTMISFTVGGHQGVLAPKDPLYLASASTSPNQETNLEALARKRLSELPDLDITEILSSRPVELDGLPAHELLAVAADRRTATRLRVHQIVVIADDRTFLLQGMVGEESSAEILPHFRRISYSFKRAP